MEFLLVLPPLPKMLHSRPARCSVLQMINTAFTAWNESPVSLGGFDSGSCTERVAFQDEALVCVVVKGVVDTTHDVVGVVCVGFIDHKGILQFLLKRDSGQLHRAVCSS